MNEPPAQCLPRLALIVLLAGAITAAIVVAGDGPSWQAAWREVGTASGVRSMGVSLGLLLAALLVGASTALAFGILLKRLPAWLRAALSLPVKAVAVFPVAALAWGFIGLWVGAWGWPIESLMPVAVDRSLATVLWTWLLPVLLLALPLTAELTACLLGAMGKSPAKDLTDAVLARRLAGRLPFVTLVGAVYLIAIEEALDLRGAAFALARGCQAGNADQIATSVIVWSVMAAFGCALAWLPGRAMYLSGPLVGPHRLSITRLRWEGAVVIGMSKFGAWHRHVLPRQCRSALGMLFEGVSWAVVAITLISALIGREPGLALAKAFENALTDPWAPIVAGVPPALCALFLWLLSRIVAPRSNS